MCLYMLLCLDLLLVNHEPSLGSTTIYAAGFQLLWLERDVFFLKLGYLYDLISRTQEQKTLIVEAAKVTCQKTLEDINSFQRLAPYVQHSSGNLLFKAILVLYFKRSKIFPI
jgi:hypothetical protein